MNQKIQTVSLIALLITSVCALYFGYLYINGMNIANRPLDNFTACLWIINISIALTYLIFFIAYLITNFIKHSTHIKVQ